MRRLDRADVLPLVATMPVLAIFAWWGTDDGGYPPALWMPGALVVAIVLGMVIALVSHRTRQSRAAGAAIAALGAYSLWAFASILWADAPGPALEGSQRTLLYVLCFTCFAILPWTPRAVVLLVAIFTLGVTVSGLFTVLHVAAAANPRPFFLNARLIGPTGYMNATAALWTAGALPALMLAARPEVFTWLRPIFLGASGLLLGLAVTTQSRGWLFTLPLVLLAALVLAPSRVRLILFAVPLAGALAVISGDLLEPYRVAEDLDPPEAGRALRTAFDGATRSLLIAVGALVAVGAAAVAVEPHLQRVINRIPTPRRRVTGALLGCLVVGCIAAGAVATYGNPVERIAREWANRDVDEESASRFAGLSTGRYAIWEVGLDAWREQPVLGLGQDNFAQTFINERATDSEEPRWLHSLPLRLLVHTGLVGFVLFVLFAVAAVWATVAAWRHRADGVQIRLAASVALLPAIVWLAHGSVDWLWEYPGLSSPTFALTGAAVALASSTAESGPESRRLSRRRVAIACVTSLACAAVVLPSYLADRDVRAAAAHWPADPERAFDRLERARGLNPFDARASLVEGVIAVRFGRLSRAQRAFERAAKREPRDWFAPFQLGLVAGARGDHGKALELLSAARRLNPRDPLIAQAELSARRGRTMSFQTAQTELKRRVERRVSVMVP